MCIWSRKLTNFWDFFIEISVLLCQLRQRNISNPLKSILWFRDLASNAHKRHCLLGNTKYLLNDFHSDSKSRLIRLELLPLMMEYELTDIMFLVKSLNLKGFNFKIQEFVEFCSNRTRSGSS